MQQQDFKNFYNQLARCLNKIVNETYVDNAYALLGISAWDSEIVGDIYNILSIQAWHKVDISAEAIRAMYWAMYKDKHMKNYEKQECNNGLCNGHGVVRTIKDGNEEGHRWAFKCTCIMGQSMSKRMPIWNAKQWPQHKIDKETIYYNTPDVLPFTFDEEVNRIAYGKVLQKHAYNKR